ncbi:unnamed protein product [Blepharisma stoltei]|uniref:Tyrosine-protein kinase ephrin type A/B receptor-like domain-containing protein n=1 Tax=Blepharisma stoltei TaxID=1481888 RepID=A0AAU9IYF0_9CILI|nr:unnamed protein product [Blepharisma stoltei]
MYEPRSYPGNILYNGCAYIIFGYSNVYTDVTSIMRLNLSDPEFKWENMSISFEESNKDIVPRDAFAFAMGSSKFYIFSGYISLYGILDNSLIEFDLTQTPLTYKILSEAYTNPDARESHSLCVLGGLFYLFGGTDGTNYLNDLWVYNPEGKSWESINSEGATPTSRSGHAADSEGNIMVIFGGEGTTGYLGDMYQYNTISNAWTLISPSSNTMPNARTGACLKMHMPYIFIYGGLANSGLSSELWVFDVGTNEYTLVYDGTNSSPTKASRPSCDIKIDDYGNINFITMYGVGSGETPLGDVDSFNFTTQKWTKLYTTNGGTPDSNRSKAIIKLLDNSLLVMCGEAWGINVYNEFYILDLTTQNITRIGYLNNYYFYDGAYVYYAKNIYSHGGGTVYGRTMRPMIVTPVFANITLDNSDISPSPYLCSPGTYTSGNTCIKCSKGYYADKYGSSECTPCPLGTFNPSSGSSSLRQCYPCDEGSYGDKEGASYCKNCPYGTICVVGTQAPIYDVIELKSKSTQPKMYSNADGDSQSAVVIMVIAVLVVSLVGLTIFIIIKPEKLKLRNIDLYSGNHNYKKDSVMKLKKTDCGGIFTIIFLVVAIIIILSYAINYQLNNIQETKTLVPLVALEDEASTFPALINVSTTLFNYGGHCKTGNSCHESISFTTTSITYDSLELSCYINNGNNCTIALVCKKCVIDAGAVVQLNLLEASSYTSAIISNVSSFSSIPDKISGIYQVLLPEAGQVFRGYNPNKFYLTMTPSLFRSYVSTWPDKLTGYHVSMDQPSSGGSQYTITDLPFSSDLRIQIWLVKNDNSLYTTRSTKQTVFLLISTMLGSVFGAMSAIGGAMRIFEKSWISIKKNHQRQSIIKEIYKRTIYLNDKDSVGTEDSSKDLVIT